MGFFDLGGIDFADPTLWIIASIMVIILLIIGIATKTIIEQPKP
jgi:hypothetical protein